MLETIDEDDGLIKPPSIAVRVQRRRERAEEQSRLKLCLVLIVVAFFVLCLTGTIFPSGSHQGGGWPDGSNSSTPTLPIPAATNLSSSKKPTAAVAAAEKEKKEKKKPWYKSVSGWLDKLDEANREVGFGIDGVPIVKVTSDYYRTPARGVAMSWSGGEGTVNHVFTLLGFGILVVLLASVSYVILKTTCCFNDHSEEEEIELLTATNHTDGDIGRETRYRVPLLRNCCPFHRWLLRRGRVAGYMEI